MTRIKSGLISFLLRLFKRLGLFSPMVQLNMETITGKKGCNGTGSLGPLCDTSGLSGQEKTSIKKATSHTSTMPLHVWPSSVPIKQESSVKTTVALPNEWEAGDFIFCSIPNTGLSDFGTVLGHTDEFCTIKLRYTGQAVNIHISNIWRAGTC